MLQINVECIQVCEDYDGNLTNLSLGNKRWNFYITDSRWVCKENISILVDFYFIFSALHVTAPSHLCQLYYFFHSTFNIMWIYCEMPSLIYLTTREVRGWNSNVSSSSRYFIIFTKKFFLFILSTSMLFPYKTKIPPFKVKNLFASSLLFFNSQYTMRLLMHKKKAWEKKSRKWKSAEN